MGKLPLDTSKDGVVRSQILSQICTNFVTPAPPHQTRIAMFLHIKFKFKRPKIKGLQCRR